MADSKIIAIAVVVLLGAFLLVVLLPISFSDVEFYEYGFKKRKSTGFVDTDKVYTSGRHLIGPDYTFKTFRADAHFEEMNKIAVFTSDKFEITITCNFQYFLRKEFLPELHEAYNVDYKPVIRSTAIDAVKGRAAQLAVDDYIRNREFIERELFKQLALRVDGCCRNTCPTDLSKIPCGRCIEMKDCKSDEKGLFVELRYFQLLAVDVHPDVKSRYLRQVTEAAEEERAEFELKEKVERKETERLINIYVNQANEISRNASAQATLIRSKAKAEALKTVEEARTNGLDSLFTAVGITSEPERSSFNYLRALRNKKNANIAVGFQNLYARAP